MCKSSKVCCISTDTDSSECDKLLIDVDIQKELQRNYSLTTSQIRQVDTQLFIDQFLFMACIFMRANKAKLCRNHGLEKQNGSFDI